MNNIDITNIKKELAKRKAANYEWKDGGEMAKDDIMLRTTKKLNELLKDYENAKNNKISEKVHKLVDEIFEKYAEKDDNMIPLSCAYRPEYRLYGDTCIEVYSSVMLSDIDGYNDNPKLKPIARNWYEEDERWENYTKDLNKLVDATVDARVPSFYFNDSVISKLASDSAFCFLCINSSNSASFFSISFKILSSLSFPFVLINS
jgi:hypothetical protein